MKLDLTNTKVRKVVTPDGVGTLLHHDGQTLEESKKVLVQFPRKGKGAGPIRQYAIGEVEEIDG